MGGKLIDREECLRLLREGHNYAEIGRRIGATRQGVRRACREFSSGAAADPLVALARARAARVAEQKHLRRQIHDLFLSGDNPKTIAWKVGKAQTTIYRHLPPSQSPTGLKFRAANLRARACR